MYPFPSNYNFLYMDFQLAPYETYSDDVVMVLDSVKCLFSKYFTFVDSLSLSVINNFPGKNGPETVRESHAVFLTVNAKDENGRPGRYWCQFIYQFSHELCHYMIANQVVQPMRWFEETICELASQFFLLKSVERWTIQPPYPGWREYSQNILAYELDHQMIDCPFSVSDLFDPSSDILKSLEKNEYQRELNHTFAINLLPHFIDSPSLWQIVPYLSELSAANTFRQNLHLLQKLSGQPIEEIILSLVRQRI